MHKRRINQYEEEKAVKVAERFVIGTSSDEKKKGKIHYSRIYLFEWRCDERLKNFLAYGILYNIINVLKTVVAILLTV